MGNSEFTYELIRQLEAYRKKTVRPFPYSDCRKLIDSLPLQEKKRFEDFTANLNTFDMAVSGPISWGKRISDWPQERVKRVYNYLQKPFFQRFPQYKVVKRLITRTNAPDLFADIRIHNEVRKILLKLLPLLIVEK